MTTDGSRLRTAAVIALGALAFLALLVRVPSIAEPVGIDQGFFASVARGLSRGQMLYRDLFDQKPPGTFLMYLTAFSLFGWRPASIAWADILASVATTLLLFAVVRRISGVVVGALAAALYAAFTIPSWLYGHGGFLERSVAETFIVVCVALAAWCGTRLLRNPATVLIVGLGLSAGATVLFKPNAAVYLPAMLLWVASCRDSAGGNEAASRRGLIRIVVVAGIASMIPLAMAVAWLWSRHVLSDAWVALVDFNRMYVGEGLSLRGYATGFSRAIGLRVKTDPLWLAGAIGSLVVSWDLVRHRRLETLPALAVLWGGAAALAIVANGSRLYNTYFIQALAPLAVLTAWLLADGARRSLGRRLIAVATAALMVAVLVQRHYPSRVYDLARADLDELLGRTERTSYLEQFGSYGNGRGYSARANEELARYISDHTTRDDFIYQFGISAAGVYFETDRLTANRFLRVNFFVPGDFADPRFRISSVTRELAAKRPVYLVFERFHTSTALGVAADALPQHPDIVRLLSAYRFDTQIEDFTLFRRLD